MLKIRIIYKINFCLFSFILLLYNVIVDPVIDAQLFTKNGKQYKIIVLDSEPM